MVMMFVMMKMIPKSINEYDDNDNDDWIIIIIIILL